MSKFLTKFETTSAYDAAKGSLNKPNVSYIVETLGVAYNPLIPAWEFDPMYLFSDGTTGKEIGSKVPVGIEVIPGSHMIDGKTRFMSLKNMSLADPENGTTATGNNTWDPENPETTNPGAGIMWGPQGQVTTFITNSGKALAHDDAHVSPDNPMGLIEDQLQEKSVNYIAGDYDFGIQHDEYPFFEDRYYYLDTTSASINGTHVQPYIFKTDGSRNLLCNQENTAIFSLNGIAKTSAMMALATEVPTGAIANETQYYPAAQVCHRFNGAGMKGQWYLPEIGELAYVWANINKINEKITAAGQYGVNVGMSSTFSTGTFGYSLWSSTENNEGYSWCLYTSCGYLSNGYIEDYANSYIRVRAFLAL